MTDANHAGISPAAVETIAGLSAGSMATLIVHPLDIAKTRMQSKHPTFCLVHQAHPNTRRKGPG